MKAYQIFQEVTPGLAREIFHYLRTEQKEVYQSAVATLAGQRKLRPIFIQRKPPEHQYVWLAKTCRLKSADEIDRHMLQLWLLKGHQEMLIEFLDGVGIEHDGEGAADDLPDTLDAEKLKKTIDELLEKNEAELVTAYLLTFQLQKDEGWEEITDLIESDDRLGLGEDEPEPEPEVESEPEAEAEAEAEPEAEAEAEAEPEPVEDSTPAETSETEPDGAATGEEVR